MAGPEAGLQDAVAAVLQRYGFLVFHQRPGRGRGGQWESSVQYDGAGYPDITALRPGCPAIFIECKVDSAMSKDQIDWMQAAQGEGRYYALVHPRTLQSFVDMLRELHQQYPAPDDWKVRLDHRKLRHTLKREAKKLVAKNQHQAPHA